MKVEIFYCFTDDIICIVDEPNKKIYKYIGNDGEYINWFDYPINKWYEAEVYPMEFLGFEKIGEL